MSSVRRLKQKSKAYTGTPKGESPGVFLDSTQDAVEVDHDPIIAPSYYDYRKAAFAGLPPATTVRPMRVVRARLAAAHAAFDRAVQAGGSAGLDWAGISEATEFVRGQLREVSAAYKRARWAANNGMGHIVHGHAA